MEQEPGDRQSYRQQVRVNRVVAMRAPAQYPIMERSGTSQRIAKSHQLAPLRAKRTALNATTANPSRRSHQSTGCTMAG
jgi:hypothetical protein